MNITEIKKFFYKCLVFFLIAEFFSIISYKFYLLGESYAWIPITLFSLILITTLLVSLKNIQNGVLIALAELFVGSKGYLFFISLSEVNISIRIGIFLILFIVLIIKLFQKRFNLSFAKNIYTTPLIALALVIAWAVINGLISNNGTANVFLDANAYLFFFYVILFFLAFDNEKLIDKVLILLGSAGVILAVKTLLLFLIYSYQPHIDIAFIYHWIRNTGVGEITHVSQNIYRIFFQAHIYSLLSFIIIITFVKEKFIKNKFAWGYILAFLNCLSVIISFSRSNWVGGIIGILAILVLLKIILHYDYLKIIRVLLSYISIVVISAIFLYLISGTFSGLIIKNRLSNITEESAGISRLNQLRPLAENIKHHFILGAGFGKNVTYQTDDPRLLAEYPDGNYTTYAFEWGYLDIFLKLGLIGFLAYTYLWYLIIKQGIQLLKTNLSDKVKVVIISLLAGLIALMTVNIFSPYLNHPLGIGYLIIMMVIFNYYAKKQRKLSHS